MPNNANHDLANSPPNAGETNRGAHERPGRSRPFLILGRMTKSGWPRRIVSAAIVAMLFAGTMGAWYYLAYLALKAEQVTLEKTLAALDAKQFQEARAHASSMLNDGLLQRNEFGGPLYVLGAVKAHEAESQATPARRRTDYLIASRYLKEARHFGFPAGREFDGMLLLGRSLLESNQFVEGVATLEELISMRPASASLPMIGQVHYLLAETCLQKRTPDLAKSLQHSVAALSCGELPPHERNELLLLQARVESRLERYDDARRTIAQVSKDTIGADRLLLADVEITLMEAASAKRRATRADGASFDASYLTSLERAMQSLEQIQSRSEDGDLRRSAAYLLGCTYEVLGKPDDARRQFSRTRQLYSDTPEALAAALLEAKLLRQQGDDEGALIGYRRVLDGIPIALSYRGDLMPLSQVREELLAAFGDLTERNKFDFALELIDGSVPVLSQAEQLTLHGQTLERWGNYQIDLAADTPADSQTILASGLRHLREAGVRYERLAELRFATSSYTDDLWKSAEAYFHGHSFSSAVRVLNSYLDNELELRNAEALLRIGQSYLALGKTSQSIEALEECIEFHPFDPSTYQARIECAKSYWSAGKLDQAERLLRDNIYGTLLKPSSHEWRDSLFLLGTLLHELGRYEEAIGVLEEANQRYPTDPQRMLSQYVIGEAYRRWAVEAFAEQREAHGDNERDRSVQLAHERLTAALRSFEEVQRSITLRAHDIHADPLVATMLRNCYMLEASVLFDLGRFDDAIKAYSNVSALYPNEPFVLETFVQIANCWHRLDRADKARGAIQQAQIALERMPGDADFASATSFSRDEWQNLLNDMSNW